jgi:hypothetical protein
LNFKAHSIGGAISATATTAACVVLDLTKMLVVPTPNFLVVWLLAYGFALYPDVDTKSTPQKVFFRLLFVISLVLIGLKLFQVCAVVLTLSIIPLLFKHRGFTHWWLSAIFIPMIFFMLFELFIVGGLLSSAFFLKYFWYMIASTAGWSTHLILDKF